MPQITTIRVVRRRSVQPEQFGSAAAEVELTGNVLEGEDAVKVARKMLIDSRALVYENLGMKLPKSAVEDAKELDTPEETATVETSEEEKEPAKEPAKKGPGRPKGSKNTAPKKGSKAAKAKEEAAKEAASDIPGDEDEKPQISTNPENRVNPDDDVPGEDGEELDIDAGEEETEEETSETFTAEDLHNYIISSIKAEKLTTQQAKQMQREMKVVRVRDLDTDEKLAKAKAMIDSFIKANEAK